MTHEHLIYPPAKVYVGLKGSFVPLFTVPDEKLRMCLCAGDGKYVEICSDTREVRVKKEALLEMVMTVRDNDPCFLTAKDERKADHFQRTRLNEYAIRLGISWRDSGAHCGALSIPGCVMLNGYIIAHPDDMGSDSPTWREPRLSVVGIPTAQYDWIVEQAAGMGLKLTSAATDVRDENIYKITGGKKEVLKAAEYQWVGVDMQAANEPQMHIKLPDGTNRTFSTEKELRATVAKVRGGVTCNVTLAPYAIRSASFSSDNQVRVLKFELLSVELLGVRKKDYVEGYQVRVEASGSTASSELMDALTRGYLPRRQPQKSEPPSDEYAPDEYGPDAESTADDIFASPSR